MNLQESKRICVTINSLSRGGAEKQCLLLAKALKPYHEVTVCILSPFPKYGPYIEFLEKERLKCFYTSGNPIRRIFDLTSFLRKNKTDIIFSFLPMDTMMSALCGRLAKVTYVFGGLRNSYLPRMKFFLLKVAHNYLLDYTIANNYAAYHSSIELGFQDKVIVIPNGIDIKPVERTKEFNQNRPIRLITMGRLVKQKGYETALQTIKRLKDLVTIDFDYRIVGQGPEEETIKEMIDEFGLKKEVSLITEPKNIYNLLQSSDIYLCTSFFEGVSNSLLEAMNCYLPIVATNVGDNSLVVLDGTSGFLSEVQDHDSLANYLNILIMSETKRKEMGLAGYTHLERNFSFRAFQNRYLGLISNMHNLEIENGQIRLKSGD